MTSQFSRKMLRNNSRKSPSNATFEEKMMPKMYQKMNFQRKMTATSEALYEDGDLAFDFLDGDISERSKFEAFITEPCGCKPPKNEKPCSSTIPKEVLIEC